MRRWQLFLLTAIAATTAIGVIGARRWQGGSLAARVRGFWARPIPFDPDAEDGDPDAHHNYYEQLHGGRIDARAATHLSRVIAARMARRSAVAGGMSAALATATLSWHHLGPFDQVSYGSSYPDVDKGSGRIISIAPDPVDANTLYIATPGGLFKSTNADSASSAAWTWTSADADLPKSFGVVLISQADHRKLYYGLNGGAAGLYVSADAGQSWSPTALTDHRVTALLEVPGALLVGAEDGLYRSIDGGASFTPVTQAVGFVNDLISLGGSSALVSVSPNGDGAASALLGSTDAGLTWSAASIPPELQAEEVHLAASPSNPSIVYASVAPASGSGIAVGKSTDGGRTFQYLASTKVTGTDADIGQTPYTVFVDPDDANKVFIGGVHLYRSTDGAQTWTQMGNWLGDRLPFIHADIHVGAWSRAGAKRLFVGDDGGLTVITDPYQAVPLLSGTYPEQPRLYDDSRNVGLGNQMVYHLASSVAAQPLNTRFFYALGVQDHGTLRRIASSDGALGISGQADTLPTGDGMGTLIHRSNGNLWLFATYNGVLFRSKDAGATYQQLTPKFGSDPYFFTTLIQGVEDDTLFHTEPQGLFQSTDFGATWTELSMTGIPSDAYIDNLAVDPADPKHLAALTLYDARGYVSQDAGATWTAFGTIPNLAPVQSSYIAAFTPVAFSPADPNVLLLGSASWDTTASHLWRSADGGATWTALDTAPGFPSGVPVDAVQADVVRAHAWYAATAAGLFSSTDDGATWQEVGTGLPAVEIMDLYQAPDGTFLRVGTYGLGAWELNLLSSSIQIAASTQARSALAGASFAVTATVTGAKVPGIAWTADGAGGPGVFSPSLSQSGDTVHVHGTGAGSLTVRARSLQDPSVQGSVSVPLKSGDLDGDGKVDVFDLAPLAQAVGQPTPNGGVDADFDSSGAVDDADITAFLGVL